MRILLFEAIVKHTGSRLQTKNSCSNHEIRMSFEHAFLFLNENAYCGQYFVSVTNLFYVAALLKNVNVMLVFAQSATVLHVPKCPFKNFYRFSVSFYVF